MLDCQHVEPEVVAQQELVDDLLQEVGGDLRVAIAIGQAGADGVRRVEDFLRHERVRDFALSPSVHCALSPEPPQRFRNFTTVSRKALGLSLSGWCPASATSAERA